MDTMKIVKNNECEGHKRTCSIVSGIGIVRYASLLGGSWVVISGVKSGVIILITGYNLTKGA